MMAELIEQTVYDGMMDYIHGMGKRCRRLLVDGMVITVDDGKVHAFRGEPGEAGKDYTKLGMVDVPTHLVELARNTIEAVQNLDGEMHRFEEIMSPRP